jgi:neutral ceramidase
MNITMSYLPLRSLVVAMALSLLIATPQSASAGRFTAGTAKVDITPAPGTAIHLSGTRLEPRDSLYARVLYLDDGDTSLAVVSLDLIVFASQKVIDEAKKKFGVDHVILSATHTHAGNNPRGLLIKPPAQPDWTRLPRAPADALDWPGLSADPWYADVEAKVVAAIGRAVQTKFPARIASGKGSIDSAYMAHNRRLVKDGKGTAFWENPNRIPTSPVDPTVGVIRIEDLAGKPRALAVQYACHPVATMTAGAVSRDFPGAMVDHVEAELGPDCLALYLQGAQGDLDPYDLHSLRGENRFNIPKQAGISLAKGALRIAATLNTEARSENASLAAAESMLTIPNRNGIGTTDVGLLNVVVDGTLALTAIPGEPFIQHQLDLSRLSPVPNSLILGVAYCGRGTPFVVYIPTVQAVKEGGYGATECSFLAADAGERIVSESVSKIRELTAAKSK